VLFCVKKTRFFDGVEKEYLPVAHSRNVGSEVSSSQTTGRIIGFSGILTSAENGGGHIVTEASARCRGSIQN
jgi:hypothetical protein